jgi:hypothetical protein
MHFDLILYGTRCASTSVTKNGPYSGVVKYEAPVWGVLDLPRDIVGSEYAAIGLCKS